MDQHWFGCVKYISALVYDGVQIEKPRQRLNAMKHQRLSSKENGIPPRLLCCVAAEKGFATERSVVRTQLLGAVNGCPLPDCRSNRPDLYWPRSGRSLVGMLQREGCHRLQNALDAFLTWLSPFLTPYRSNPGWYKIIFGKTKVDRSPVFSSRGVGCHL